MQRTPAKAHDFGNLCRSNTIATDSVEQGCDHWGRRHAGNADDVDRSPGDVVTSIVPAALLVKQTYLIFSEVSYLYTPAVGYVMGSPA